MKTQEHLHLATTTITWTVPSQDGLPPVDLSFQHSRHSELRAIHRGITQEMIARTIEFGKAFFKQGLIFYVLGGIPEQNDCRDIVVVVAGDSNTIITCYRGNKAFKHIRKKEKHLVRLPIAA